MRFRRTEIDGVVVVDIERHQDDRGFFARTWCARELGEQALDRRLAQCSISHNIRRGTLRGMHYQAAPRQEAKLVRVTRGAIWDVALDLREGSETYLRWVGVELSADNRTALFVPEGCAHGFETLVDDVEVLYMISVEHAPELARGVRWDDPAFAIRWPVASPILSERDRSFPLWPAQRPKGSTS